MKKILIALLSVMLLASVGFSATDTSSLSATLVAANVVAIGDIDFGRLVIGSGYTKAASDLTFENNEPATARLEMWTENPGAVMGMISGEESIPLKYFFNLDGTASPDVNATTWETDWVVVNDIGGAGSKNLIWTGGPIMKSMPGDCTLDFATNIEATASLGVYSCVLNFEIATV